MAERLGMLGLPLDANSSHRAGCAGGPAAIRGALFSTSGNAATEAGVEVVGLLDDLGDLDLANEPASVDDADRITTDGRARCGAGSRS